MSAAHELERVFDALSASMYPSRELDISRRGTGGHFAPVNWLERIPAAVYRLWVNHYMPWCHAMEKVRMTTSPRMNIISVVVSVVVDNWSLRQCERHYGLKCHGEAMRLLHAGLTAYAKVAGY